MVKFHSKIWQSPEQQLKIAAHKCGFHEVKEVKQDGETDKH